jgi:predicted permease
LYSLVIILVLALALGANTLVFSVFNGLYLRSMPYPNDERLVRIDNTYPKIGLDWAGTSVPDYLDRRERARSLEDIAIYMPLNRTLSGDGATGSAPTEILTTLASPSFFDVLGVTPLIGRPFNDMEATVGNHQVAILSYALWSTRFGAEPGVVGSVIRLDGESYRVVGVMPQSFSYPNGIVGLWTPFAYTPEQSADSARFREFAASIGRLRPGATLERLNAEMDTIVQQNVERLPEIRTNVDGTGFTGRARFLRDVLVGDLEQTVIVLQGIVFALLLLACANIANLQLAQMAARRKEMSVRTALGADRGRLVRLVLLEQLVLAVFGAAAGLLLVVAGLEVVRRLGLDRVVVGFEYAIDLRVLGFTAAMTACSALASSALPLITLMREKGIAQLIHEVGRLGGGGQAAHRFRAVLVVVQLAVSVALLVAAGLLTKSFHALQQQSTGFDAEYVWTARVALPRIDRFADGRSAQFFERALEELRALPGVAAAGFSSAPPFSGMNPQQSADVDGYTPPAGAPGPHAQLRIIDDSFLSSLGIPVVIGRDFNRTESERVVIVDQNMVGKYWPNVDPIGQRLRMAGMPGQVEEWATVVGVVPAIRHGNLAEEATKETVYWHYEQRPLLAGMFTLRTTIPPEQLGRIAQDAVLRVDSEVALFEQMPMEQRVADSLGPQRAPMALTIIFAAGAFLLTTIGVYSMLTWAVTQRFGEIGVRLALGATGADVVRMVLRQGARLIAIGLAFGVIGALVLGRLMASQVYEISGWDPTVFVLAIVSLTGAALVATWLPARRASHIDPMLVLRQE